MHLTASFAKNEMLLIRLVHLWLVSNLKSSSKLMQAGNYTYLIIVRGLLEFMITISYYLRSMVKRGSMPSYMKAVSFTF